MCITPITPSLKLDLKSDRLSVADLKQLWPAAVATQARLWAKDGITGGVLKNAWVKSDIPAGVLGRIEFGQRLEKDQLTAELPVEGASVRTYGDIPRIQGASGTVRYAGMDTLVKIEDGFVRLGKGRKLKVSASTLTIGDHTLERVPSKLSLGLKGAASAFAELGQSKTLGFARKLNVRSDSLTGAVKADVDVTFDLIEGGEIIDVRWAADLRLAKVASKAPLFGRRLSNADLTIKANPKAAHISGSANIDGIAAKIALVEPLAKNSPPAKRDIRLVLDDAARKKMGIDTADIVSGPVEVSLKLGPGGSQSVNVDLTGAKLSLPWLGWIKGKGIAGQARFNLEQTQSRTRLSDIVIKGASFSARGSLSNDKQGLAKEQFSGVMLNKLDSFDVKVARIKGGYDIQLAAKSYDGRALIRSFLNNSQERSSGNGTLVVRGTVDRLVGFRGQSLEGVTLDYRQRGGRVSRAVVKAVAEGNAPTLFRLEPKDGGMATEIKTSNAGSVFRFLDLYSKVRGGTVSATLVRDDNQVFKGLVIAENFVLLDEPRLGSLLAPAGEAAAANDREGRFWTNAKKKRKKVVSNPNRATINRLTARVSKGPGFLKISKGRVQGGDAAAAFDGTVYDRANKMNIKGTYLPARGLNRVVANIPLISQILGRGKTKGIFGVTFRLSGPYKNPKILLNPISLIAPGVFRKLFEF